MSDSKASRSSRPVTTPCTWWSTRGRSSSMAGQAEAGRDGRGPEDKVPDEGADERYELEALSAEAGRDRDRTGAIDDEVVGRGGVVEATDCRGAPRVEAGVPLLDVPQEVGVSLRLRREITGVRVDDRTGTVQPDLHAGSGLEQPVAVRTPVHKARPLQFVRDRCKEPRLLLRHSERRQRHQTAQQLRRP